MDFDLIDIPKVTVDALKKMVESRNMRLKQRHGFCTLNVSGSGPSLSAEDRVWLEENTLFFSWETTGC